MARRNIDREPEIARLYAAGWTQKAIGERFGVTQQAISRVIDRLRRESKIDKEDLMFREAMILDVLRRDAMEIADSGPVPVTAGKDGDIVRNPETGEVVWDHSGRLAAMARVQSTSESLRKLVGLDQPTRAENVEIVRYEVVGLSDGDLE